MKISIETKELNMALTEMNKFQTNTIKDIYKNNHFLAQKEQLIITAIYGPTVIQKTIPCKIEEEGVFLTDPKLLLSLIKCINEQDVVMQLTGTEIQILNGWNTTKIRTIDPDTYPSVNFDKDVEAVIKIEAEKLKKSIRNTVFAAASEHQNVSQQFKGTEIIFRNNQVDFVATNTHCLARSTIKTENNDGCMTAIIPTNIINNLQNNKIQDKTVEISIRKNRVMIKYDNTIISTLVIEGVFPDTDRFFNQSYSTKLRLKTDEIIEALERVQLFANQSKVLKININKEEQNMFLTTNSELGNAVEAIHIQQIEGELENVALNVNYLANVCKKIEEEEFIMELNTSLTPLLIHDGNEDTKYIITPMRVA